jgi:long-chain acyl-CoA synthetase
MSVPTALRPALDDGTATFDTDRLLRETMAFARQLQARDVRVLATQMDNGPAWIVADLAARDAGVVHVPLPPFFGPQQVQHALQSAGADALLFHSRLGASRLAEAEPIPLMGEDLALAPLAFAPRDLPAGTRTITFTSGTTGTPKGVCLGGEAMQAVAAGLAQALAPLAIGRHLCALPLAVLLENVAGVLAPLSVGATCIVPPLESVGWTGPASFDPARFDDAVRRHAPHSVILLPQMLAAWTAFLQSRQAAAAPSLRFAAVGGARVGENLLRAARACGIPAHEGYGLSEGASVQTLNLPGADWPGSAGRPLPHANARIAADGEIEIAGSLFLGYAGDAAPVPAWWPTGDLGTIDARGFLHVVGRKKNVLITSFGRNVSPEWVEALLCEQPGIAAAVVFGDGEPALSAVLWPAAVRHEGLQGQVERANALLPPYARIARWTEARRPLTPASGLATANGRPRREAIWQLHRDQLAAPAAHPSQEDMA